MPINAHPDYLAAEKEYHLAQTLEEKLRALEKMMSYMPRHKGGENLRAQLRLRYKKLKEKIKRGKKTKKSAKTGIKKQDMQAVIIGETQIGKSRLLGELTNAKPKIGKSIFEEYTTKHPEIGVINYNKANIQLIENPAIESRYYNKGITNTADTLIILFADFSQLERIEKAIENSLKKRIIIFMNNKNESLEQLRKISARLQSKKYNFIILNIKTRQGLEELKDKIFQSFDKIRIYTKEPGKVKTDKPIILKLNSTVKDVAEKILHGLSQNIKKIKIWGPSSKFPGQTVGLAHKLKDLDVVEFKTR